jgi:NADH:ubiquinone oxidoreductase subunit 4 (subunit M)
MLHMVARVIFGPLKYPGFGGAADGRGLGHGTHGDSHGDSHGHAEVSDISGREISILVPIALAVVILGVMPMGIMRSINTPIEIIRSGMVAQQQVPHRSRRLAAANVKIEKEPL